MTMNLLAINSSSWFRRLSKIKTRFIRSLKEHGYWGTMENILAVFHDVAFDRKFGIETSRTVALHDLEVRSENKNFGADYSPTRIRAFQKLMEWLKLPEGRVFVDVGCGKGRVLIAAAAYSFRRIVGVEFAGELCKICRNNIKEFQYKTKSSTNFIVHEIDAAKYVFADDEDVLFFNNPFKQNVVMRKVLKNIKQSLQQKPRTIWLIVNIPNLSRFFTEIEMELICISKYAYGSSTFWIYSNNMEEIARLDMNDHSRRASPT